MVQSWMGGGRLNGVIGFIWFDGWVGGSALSIMWGNSWRRMRMGGRYDERRRRALGRALRSGRSREMYIRSMLLTVKSSHFIIGIRHHKSGEYEPINLYLRAIGCKGRALRVRV